MAVSWFAFNPPGVSPKPFVNPLSFTQVLFTPPFTPGGPNLHFIHAVTQIIAGTTRPIISPILSAQITSAVSTGTSSTSVYMGL